MKGDKGKAMQVHDRYDEEDEENLDEFETDGFIVDWDGEEEDEVEEEQKKRRKRKSLKHFILDDEDLALINENRDLVIYQPQKGSSKLKRLKNFGNDAEGMEPSGFSEDEELLFDIGAENEEYTSDYEVDDMDDFIVHDEVDMNETESHIRKRKVNLMKLRRVPRESSGHIVGSADQLLKNKKAIVTSDYFGEGAVSTMEIDIPERMQVLEEIEGSYPFDETNTEEEASWIISQLATNIYPVTFKRTTMDETEGNDYLKKIKREDIVRFLNLHHVEKYDVPFIAMYRKEQCLSLLDDTEQDEAVNTAYGDAETAPTLKWHKVLWAIKELDRKWLLLQKRKSSLHTYYNKRYEEEYRHITDETILTFNKQVFESITQTLKNSESERDIDDAEKKFRLHFPPVEDRMDGKFKRPKEKSEYNNCFKAGLRQLARKFGYKAEQFGSRITMEKAEIAFWEDAEESPEEVASNFMSEIFETPEAVLKGARHMIAVEISSEPSLRKHARCIFMDKAVVSTNPTLEGKSAIDSFHKFAGVERLREKPLCKFEGAQWLLIQKAEEEKLLEVNIKLPEDVLDKIARDFNGIYLVDGGGRYAWDEQRKLILKDAFSNHLLPSLEKEARTTLTARAKIWIRMEYAKQLWSRVSVAPSQRRDLVAKEKGIQPRVMACCWGPGKPATTFVMLDSSGEILNILHAGSISLRSQNVIDQQRKRNDQQRVLKFITDYLPHVIVIGASNVSCMRLKDDISQIVEDSRVVGQYVDGISVVYGDESLPDLYEHSQISSDQLPGQPGIVKRAVALGRYLQNPLAMVATLCGDQKEIVSWQLCTLDHFLTAHEKYEMIEWVMMDVTNQVGLNINEAVKHGWLLATMQFISGLGPKRVASLKRGLSNSQGLSNRKELTDCGLRTKKVFYNAVGFFRVHCCELLSVCSNIHFLDDTRVHPESYDLAETLAKAVHPHCDQDGMDTDLTPAEAIEYIKDNLQVLKDFDIDAFADKYEKEEGKDRRHTLRDIKNELIHGFLDPRRPCEVPTEDEEFSMMAGKHAHELVEGRVVSAIVRRVLSQRVFCALDSGLTGMLSKDDFSDKSGDFSLTEKLREGDILTCKIKQIEKRRFQVLLTCKESEMKNSSHQSNLEVDTYYFREQSDSVTQQEKAKKQEVGIRHFKITRMIDHPRFYNMTSDQAMEFLSGKDAGESIFHPSSRGPFYLTLTLKVCDELYAHKDITEGGKEHKDIASLLQIGTTLKIGDEIFENLDEVIDRYIEPLVMHLKSMITFRKFKKGSKVEIDELLRVEKAEYPMRIVYCFCASYEHPGTFILSYIRSTNLRHEYVGLNPKGFKFRKHMFGKIEHLVAHFQKHIDDSQQELAPMRSASERGLTANTWGSENSCHTNSDENRSSAPGSRGRDGGGRGRGRGRGRSSFGNGSDEPGNSGAPKWSSGFHDGSGTGGGRGKFSGAEDENLSWSCGSGGATGGGSGNWASGNTGGGSGNWGSGDNGGGRNWGSGDNGGGGRNWGSGDKGGGGRNWGSGDKGDGGRNWGGDEEGGNDGGRGRGRGSGRGRGPSYEECGGYGSAPKWSSSLNSSGGDESWGSKWEGGGRSGGRGNWAEGGGGGEQRGGGRFSNRGGRGNWADGGGGEQRGGGRFSNRGGRGNWADGGGGEQRGGGRFSNRGGRGRSDNDGGNGRGRRGRGGGGGRFSDGGGGGRGRRGGRGSGGNWGGGEDGGWGAGKDGGGWGKKSWDEAQNENTGGGWSQGAW